MRRLISFLRAVLTFLRRVNMAIRFAVSPPADLGAESYFPEQKKKKRRQIMSDMMRHIMRHGEIDKYYFIYGFDGKDSSEMKEYLAYIKFMDMRNERNYTKPYSYVCLLRDKRLFEIFGKACGAPVVNSGGVLTDGMVDSEGKSTPFMEYAETHPHLFVKSISGECGEGVFAVQHAEGRLIVNGEEKSADTFLQGLRGGYIVQPRLIQHAAMSKLYPHSVNTLRIVTVFDKKSDAPVMFASLLRIGAHGNQVDNWAQGGIAVGVRSDGYLCRDGFYKPGKGTRCQCHPETGVVFESFKVPFFEEAIERCLNFHKEIKVHSIGWDVAITEQGPVLIEGNDNWEVSLMQACCGPKKARFTELCQ